MWKNCWFIWLTIQQYILLAIPQTKWEYRSLISFVFIAGRVLKTRFVCLNTFLCSPILSSDTWMLARDLSRLDPALSHIQGFSFIAQTFTILFAMYQPAVWQRPPLCRRDIFRLFFFFSKLRCCILEGGYMIDKFHFVPATIIALLFEQGGFGLQAFVRKKRGKGQNQLIACYCKPTWHTPVFAVVSSATVLVWFKVLGLFNISFIFRLQVRLASSRMGRFS